MNIVSSKIQFVINGDDFGMSSAVNQAILYAFQNRLISSSTMMANMPGYEEACALIETHNLRGRVGVHINLVEGVPLSAPIRECRRFCSDDGAFSGHLLKRALRLSHSEERALHVEMSAQIEHCLDRGIVPTHLDSHHHYHTSWPIGTVLIQVARQYKIGAIRLNRNCGPYRSSAKSIFRTIYNYRLRLNSLAGTDYFGNYGDFDRMCQKRQGIVEMVLHPRLNSENKVIDLEEGRELSAMIEGLGSIEMVPYLHQ